TDFIQQSLDDAKKKLDDEDAKLAQFKRTHPGTLPDQEQTNLTLLTNLNSQLDSNTQALSRAQQDKTFNQSLLASQEAAQKQTPDGTSPESADQQLNALKDQLLALQAKYTPEHPDVLRTERAIEELKKRMDAQQKAGAPAATASKAPTLE